MGRLNDLSNALQQGCQDVLNTVTGDSGSSTPVSTSPPSSSTPGPADAVFNVLMQILDTVSAAMKNGADDPVTTVPTPTGLGGFIPVPYLNFGSMTAEKPKDTNGESPLKTVMGMVLILIQLMGMTGEQTGSTGSNSRGQARPGSRADRIWFLEMAKRLHAVLPGKSAPKAASSASGGTLTELLRLLQLQQFKMRSRGPTQPVDPRRLQSLLLILDRSDQILRRIMSSKSRSGNAAVVEVQRLLGALHTTKTAFHRKVASAKCRLYA